MSQPVSLASVHLHAGCHLFASEQTSSHTRWFLPRLLKQQVSSFVQSAAYSAAPPQQSEAGLDQGHSSRPSSDKFLSLMQSLFRVSLSLGNHFYRTSTHSSHSLEFPYQCCEVCSKHAGWRASRKALDQGFIDTNTAAPLAAATWCSWLSQICHTAPRAFTWCAVLSHALCSSASEMGAAYLWAQASFPGQGTASPQTLRDSHP